MFSKFKGQKNYLKKQPLRIGAATVIMLLFCATIYLVGFFMAGGSPKNIMTVIAILGMLPVAKLIVSFIMYIRAEKYSCPGELVKNVEDAFTDKATYGFDFFLTSEKKNFPLGSCFVYENSLIAYILDKNVKTSDCKEHIEKYLSNNSITGIKVYILSEESKFLERVKSVDLSSYQLSENEEKAFALIKSLSL